MLENQVYSKKRPRFGRSGQQIRTIRGLKQGGFVISIALHSWETVLYKVVGRPTGKNNSNLTIKVARINEQGKEDYRKNLYMSDYSVVPDKNAAGKIWNMWNCLIRTKMRTANPRYLSKYKKEDFRPTFD